MEEGMTGLEKMLVLSALVIAIVIFVIVLYKVKNKTKKLEGSTDDSPDKPFSSTLDDIIS
ncbi:hypothetical protein GW793_00670 [bacterium]|uniref:Uncharacterized protein n=2 Tax=Katanobacteria TaxID=422282 RepID=A0A2M7X0U0_UNCKA|nr:hypothetical protein [bacterium]PIP56683.1 MAG: hypothetical protein COX05_01780 [candidate division WWE3 bacterium CG22_combo_CG10-13_8_21_14_all_39_12]PJA39790.1 MAG: hypothetical protein CO179_04470 [candidate division WWE3 bacterium CG_4_9_14_3_um_filter_39_7]